MTEGVDFLAPCAEGHPDAHWRTALQQVAGAGDDYLGPVAPVHLVQCDRCDAERDG